MHFVFVMDPVETVRWDADTSFAIMLAAQGKGHRVDHCLMRDVYLEDGRYSVTDEEGKYHFDDVMPGSHVVQIDTVTIPDTHRTLECSDRVHNAGRAYS